MGDQNGIPPTNSFQMINMTGGNVTAQHYNDYVTFLGSGVTITPNYSNNTILFTTSGGTTVNELYCTLGEFFSSFNATTGDFTCAATSGSGGALDDVLLEGTEISNSRSNLNFNDTNKIDFTVTDDSILDAANVTAVIVTGSVGDNELGTGIDTTQFGAGGVTSTEFGYIGTLTSDVQPQLNTKVDTSANSGAGAGTVLKTVSGTTLTAKTIKAGSNIGITNNADDITIDATDTGEANTASNIGSGEAGVFKTKSGVDLQLKTLKQGTGITITNNTNDITIASSVVDTGEVNTASNVGTGEGSVFKQKSGVDLQFKTLKQAAGISITNNTSDLTIGTTFYSNSFTCGGTNKVSAYDNSTGVFTCSADVDTNTGQMDDVYLDGTLVSDSRPKLDFNDTSVIDFTVTDDSSFNAANVTATIVTGSIGDTQLGTGIDTTQFGVGGVTSTEFGYIGTLTSDAQTQLNTKVDTSANSGAGAGTVLKTVSGTTLTAKTIKAGTGISVTNNADDVTIASTGGSNALLDGSAHTDTVAQTVSRGSLIYGDSTPKWNELTIGLNGKVLHSDGTDASWQTLVESDIPTLAKSKISTSGTWVKADLPATVVHTDQVNTYTDGKLQAFTDDDFAIQDNSGGQYYTFSTGDVSANRTISLPVLTADDTFDVLGLAQTITGAKTFNDQILKIRNPADTQSYTIVASAITAGRSLTLPLTTQTETLAVQPQKLSSAVTNPTGTTNTSGVMAGIGSTCAITPRVTGNVFIIITGQGNTNTGDDGWGADLRYGTGTAPANAAALTGTVLQLVLTGSGVASSSTTAIMTAPITLQGIATGLTVGTAYWIDIGERAVTGGTASFTNLRCSAFEM